MECPVCLELPEGEVHQCNEGHCCCVRCWNRLAPPRRCPECRQPVPLVNRNKAIERTIAALAWSCEHCGVATTRGAKTAHLAACPQRPTVCAAAAAGCGWAGIVSGEVAHEAACPFAICQRMMAPLQARCDGLQAENQRLQRQVAALQPLAGRMRALEEGEGGRRQRQRVGPAPHDAPPSGAALAAMGLAGTAAALRAHVAVAQVAEKACERLVALSDPNGSEQAAAEAGAIEDVVAAMQAHQQVSGVQESACGALRNICWGDDAAGLARSQRAAEAGAIEAVVNALRAHPQVEQVQEKGCHALMNICCGDEVARLTFKHLASQLGGRAAIAAAMAVHPENDEIQASGERLLEELPG